MLQVSFLRENMNRVTEGLKKRNFKNPEWAEKAVQLDDERKKIQFELDSQLSDINKISKEIGLLMKEGKNGGAEQAKSKTSELKESTKNKPNYFLAKKERNYE